jgi:hypothetical protein
MVLAVSLLSGKSNIPNQLPEELGLTFTGHSRALRCRPLAVT